MLADLGLSNYARAAKLSMWCKFDVTSRVKLSSIESLLSIRDKTKRYRSVADVVFVKNKRMPDDIVRSSMSEQY